MLVRYLCSWLVLWYSGDHQKKKKCSTQFKNVYEPNETKTEKLYENGWKSCLTYHKKNSIVHYLVTAAVASVFLKIFFIILTTRKLASSSEYSNYIILNERRWWNLPHNKFLFSRFIIIIYIINIHRTL